MDRENIKDKIIKEFSKDMDFDSRHLLMRIYNACDMTEDIKEPPKSLIYIEEAYDDITNRINNLYKKMTKYINTKDDINNNPNIKREYNVSKKINDIENLNIIKFFNNRKIESFDNKELFNNHKIDIKSRKTYDYSLLSKVLENYIMLTDCLENYNKTNNHLKKKILLLLTKTELLLNIPVTYASELDNVVEDILENHKKNDRGEKIVKRYSK